MKWIACLLLSGVAIIGEVLADSPTSQIPSQLASLHSMQSVSPRESEKGGSSEYVTKACRFAREQLRASSTSNHLYFCSKTGALVEHSKFKDSYRFLIIPSSLEFRLKPTNPDDLKSKAGIDIKMVYEIHRQREAVWFGGGPSFAILAEIQNQQSPKVPESE